MKKYFEIIKAQNKETKFCFVYLDDDKIPELLIFDGDYNAAGARIYWYKSGKIKSSEYAYGYMGNFRYVEKGGYFYDESFGQGAIDETYYSFKNGKIKQLIELFNDGGAALDKETYMINGKETTEAKYRKACKKYENHKWSGVGYNNGTFSCSSAELWNFRSYIK